MQRFKNDHIKLPTRLDIATMAPAIHKAHEKWWIDLSTGLRKERNEGEIIALVHSELSEAAYGVQWQAKDDHLHHRMMEEVEMADAIIRILDWVGGMSLTDEVAKMENYLGRDFEMDVRQARKDHGHTTSVGRRLIFIALLHSEASKWLEAARKNFAKNRIEAIALLLYNIEVYCAAFKLNLMEAMHEKLAYNANRADHKIENRIKDGGKKF